MYDPYLDAIAAMLREALPPTDPTEFERVYLRTPQNGVYGGNKYLSIDRPDCIRCTIMISLQGTLDIRRHANQPGRSYARSYDDDGRIPTPHKLDMSNPRLLENILAIILRKDEL